MTPPSGPVFSADLSGTVRGGAEPMIPVGDSAVTHGDGAFETILVTAGTPLNFAEHCARLGLSGGILDIAVPDAAAWQAPVGALTEAWRRARPAEQDFVLRLTATRSGSVFATAAAVPDRAIAGRSGISVILAPDPFNRRAPYLTTVAKSLSYGPALAALRYARARGADDVIFLADDGTITEAPTATVVVCRGGELISPPPGPETGILPGITAATLRPTYRRVTAQDLATADGVYLVSAVRLAAPVISIDGALRPHDESFTSRLTATLKAAMV